MVESSLFFHIEDRDCTYYDVFTFTEQRMREVGFNVKRGREKLQYALEMLILAIALVGGKPLAQIKKYPEMLRFALLFKDSNGLNDLITMFDGSYVSCGLLVLNNKVMTPNDFDIYEKVVHHFFLKEEAYVSESQWKSIKADYDAAKMQVQNFFEAKEKDSIDEGNNEKNKIVDNVSALDSPYKLSKYLKRYVKGQDEAVDVFSNVAYQYSKYVKANKTPPKSYNILIIGPSGSGKTTMMNAFDNVLSIKKLDCSGVTESGFRGTNAKDLIKYSEFGRVVFYDEFDKILMPVYDGESQDTHKEVQSCFYKMMEDAKAFNVFAGAFEGLNEIVNKRLKSRYTHIGFSTDDKNIDEIGVDEIMIEDLCEYGATREFLGRIDVIIKMRELDEHDYYKIITDSEYSPIKLEKVVAKDCYSLDLEIGDGFYKELAARVSEQEIGARGLKQVINKIIDPILALAMEKKCYKVVVNSLEGEPKFVKDKEL